MQNSTMVTDFPVKKIGSVIKKTGLKSFMEDPSIFPDYKIMYPNVVKMALMDIYKEYNGAFGPLVEKNREWKTDYQYCMVSNTPVNYLVQVDMVGLSSESLTRLAVMTKEDATKILRKGIFEIENSLAVYQLLGGIFSEGENDSFFKRQLRMSLERLRQIHQKPIALLATTEGKYEEMRKIEFGKAPGELLTDEEVKNLSGFDRFFGPNEFKQYLSFNNGDCDYLLYPRTSDPVDKLKNPSLIVEQPLLSDESIRRIIKAYSLVLNIDSPDMNYDRKINDTKEYTLSMGMGFSVCQQTDIISPLLENHLLKGNSYSDYYGKHLSDEFLEYMKKEGFDYPLAQSGEIRLLCKPMKSSYGCYGHVSGNITNSKFRSDLKNNLRKRGPYILQPEMEVSKVINSIDGLTYAFIDRAFFSTDGSYYDFMGGFRNLMPLDSMEAKRGRVHGSISTVYLEII